MAHTIQKAPEWTSRLPTVIAGYHSDEATPELKGAVEAADSSKAYLHWDNFRYRELPKGWSAKDLWAIVKFIRLNNERSFSLLKQKSGDPFTLSPSGPMTAALHRVDTKEVLWKEVLAPTHGKLDTDTYRMMAATEEAYRSSAIEGAVTTRRESRELIRTDRAPQDRSEQMVLNNYHAVQRLDQWKESVLTPQLICEIQSVVTRDTLDDPNDVGSIRADDTVRIHDKLSGEVIFQPPRASELEERMDSLCKFANETPRDEEFLSPITRAILIHHQLAYDHPFADGNGRTARTLFMWSMLRAGYEWLRAISISRAIYHSRSDYYRSFQHVQLDSGDVTYFVRYQLQCLEREIERLTKFLASRREVAEWLRDRNVISKALNSRQLALVDYALRHPKTVFTQREHRQFHGVTQPTAWKDLQRLVEQGLLVESRVGRKALYKASRKLVKLSKERPN